MKCSWCGKEMRDIWGTMRCNNAYCNRPVEIDPVSLGDVFERVLTGNPQATAGLHWAGLSDPTRTRTS